MKTLRTYFLTQWRDVVLVLLCSASAFGLTYLIVEGLK